MNGYDEEIGYLRALKAAGFEVIDYEQFGSYQGDLLVFVKLNQKYGFIIEQYGSCGGCDVFEAEVKTENPEALRLFGERYFDDVRSYDEALKYVSRHAHWDQEAKQMVEWVESHRYVCDFDKMLEEQDKPENMY